MKPGSPSSWLARCISVIIFTILCALGMASAHAEAFHNPYGKLPAKATAGDVMFQNYFRQQSRALAQRSLAEVQTPQQWNERAPVLRQQLFEMLGLDPLPARTDLKPTITGKIDHTEFTVEKLHFQSMPGLYVTANLYLPKGLKEPAPAILYVCGHSQVKSNDTSYGCKVGYQHHGIWFARNGYVCLVLDTVELGEIEGRHHGTYRDGMWWWNSRGYSSAAAEAWNCIRALDYLETRPEVDKTRFGVTGRSGGGAYSWWISALDERIKAACPVAGITDLENHVVDGTVEGHCDCMFMVNTYRWDFAEVAALVVPRPLLICNTDKDTIFPLDGVNRLYERTRRIYDLCGASDKLGLLVTEGGHHDTQDLQVPVFRWFNRFLKNSQAQVEMAAVPLFSGPQLKVFETVPADEITSKCFENFTVLASDAQPADAARIIPALQKKTFGGWPESSDQPLPKQISSSEFNGVRLSVYEFESEQGIQLRFYLAQPVQGAPEALYVETVDDADWLKEMRLARSGFASALRDELAEVQAKPSETESESKELERWMQHIRDHRGAYVTFAPRGVGLTRLTNEKAYVTQVRRRFMLLGKTLAGMQTWDVRRAIQAARLLKGLESIPLHLYSSAEMAEVVTFAAVFEPGVTSMTLPQAPRNDKAAPDFLNWSRIVTPRQLLSLAQSRCKVSIGREQQSADPQQ